MSARTLSIFLRAFLNGFPSLLTNPSSINEVLRVKPDANIDAQYGLIWHWQTYNGRRLVGHLGSIPGNVNVMLANEKRTLGVIILSNGDVSTMGSDPVKIEAALRAMLAQLFDCYDSVSA